MVEAKLTSMSVADRVGQLFLITFAGDDIGFDSDIAELIYGYRVGGVVIDPSNGNFSNELEVDTPRQVAALVNRLQALAYGVLLSDEEALQPLPKDWRNDPEVTLEGLTEVAPLELPLFIGVTQLGDNLPETTLRRGFTPLPSQMAIGASWDPALAEAVGQIVGAELQAVGVNMLLGPNLDVLDQPRSGPVGRLGLHMFGGDPFWVGRMGQAYITGVHSGGDGRIATIAGHFPGAGDIDRLPEEEVSTVQRTLAELEQIALPPFQAVTGQQASAGQSGAGGLTDGMMSSLARYSAFQGSSLGRNTPIGLAPELEMVLEEAGFSEWRANGGILVSGELGAPAVRNHYDASSTDFPYRRIALDAFTAGHDLLYLGRFASDEAWDSQRLNIKETIGFFQERYVDDPDFAQAVDERVRRLLRLKLRLYEADSIGLDASAEASSPIPLESVQVTEANLDYLADGRVAAWATVSQVARKSVSILYPDPREASEVFSQVPQKGEQILVFTDSRLQQECKDCRVEAAVGPDEIENIILRLYGPDATDQLAGDEITSLTFGDLEELLDAELAPVVVPIAIPTVTPAPTVDAQTDQPESEAPESDVVAPAPSTEAEANDGLDKNSKTSKAIDDAEWILFAMLDVDNELYPHSDALNRFLRQHSDDLAAKTVVVFSLHAPYFLDATEISKLNGYYGVYSKTQPFLEDAVRALFRPFTPAAAPPIGVLGTRFSSLSERLAPDPGRSIDLVIADQGQAVTESLAENSEAPIPTVQADTTLQLVAGPVIDRNGNPVGDGELVQFVVTYDGDESAQRVETSPTRRGTATREFRFERGGAVAIMARAGNATSGQPIQVIVEGGASLSAIASAATPPTEVAAADGVRDAEGAAASPADGEAASGLQPSAREPRLVVEGPAPVSLASLFVALITITIMVSMLVILQVRIMPRGALTHSILWAVNCGLVAYILYGFGYLPGAQWLQTSLSIWGSAIVVFVAMLLPLLWLQLRVD